MQLLKASYYDNDLNFSQKIEGDVNLAYPTDAVPFFEVRDSANPDLLIIFASSGLSRITVEPKDDV